MQPVLLKYNFVTVEHDENRKILCLTWNNYFTCDEYIVVMRKLLELSKQYNISHWLIDSRKLGYVLMANLSWTIDYLGDMLANSPVRKIARIKTKDDSNEVVLNESIQEAMEAKAHPFQFQVFENKREAVKWLLKE